MVWAAGTVGLVINGATYRDMDATICLILPVRIRICTEMLARTLHLEGYVARVIQVTGGDEGARQA